MNLEDTIVALSTPYGAGAIAVIRLSGANSFPILEQVFYKNNQPINIEKLKTHTTHFGQFRNKEEIIDEVLVAIFKNPNSYTGEDVVEISCHGSTFIQKQILELLIAKGARMAEGGEFTQRAFLNGKLDLTQAEAVADLIASESSAQHAIAMQQMRGGFSSEINHLREQLINFASLIELELDFSEEDVEFANRGELQDLIQQLILHVTNLIESFAYGNVIKEGVPVAIIGKPNAGKSSLLNALLNEERAIVSDIPGTTRDTVEDTLVLEGIKFRFIDTAGIRETTDTIEALGVERAKAKAKEAKIALYLFDRNDTTPKEICDTIKEIYREDLIILLIENKIDLQGGFFESEFTQEINRELIENGFISTYQAISAHNPSSVESVKNTLTEQVKELNTGSNFIVTNTRHKQALENSLKSLQATQNGLTTLISGDLLAMDIREALKHLGSITGKIDVDKDILGTIFGRFCIGK